MVENGLAVESGAKGAFARCPECEFREGPFTHVSHANDALLKHIDKKHGALIAFLRQRPLPSGNEGFMRANIRTLMRHAARLQKTIDSPISSGPIDVPTEMIALIVNVSQALASTLDVLAEMRTGQCELIPQKKSDAPMEKDA